MHVARFGERFDAQGVLSGSSDAARCIGYLTKYLTKQVADCHQAASDAQRDHVDRLAEALRYEPCSPRCANWLRYGIQPRNARPGLHPGACKGKAHRREHLGYAGRRVLVSRKWSGKTLADHRADRKNWLPGHPRQDGGRPRPLRLGTGRPRRPRLHGTRPPRPARRRRPPALASRPQRSQTPSWPRTSCLRGLGNREGGMSASSQDSRREPASVAPVVHTVAEAAVILRVKRSWLERRAAAREIPFTMLGGAYHFTAEHIAEIVRMNEQRPAVVSEPQIGRRRAQERHGDEAAMALRPRPRPEGPHRKQTAA